MLRQITLLLLFTLGTLAQTTVQSIFFPNTRISYNAFVGSVIDVANGITTYAIACTSGNYECYTGTSITVTEGISTFALSTTVVTNGQTGSVFETCRITGTTSAHCVEALSVNANGVNTAATTTVTLGPTEFHYHPITITAGASKLNGPGATSASGNAAPAVTGLGIVAGAALGLAALL